jgi:hypothetical protein
MSIDCGQFSGVNNCRFMNSANAYFSLEEAYAEQQAPSEAMALRDYCAKGMNASDSNKLSSFQNQAFGAFNQPAAGAVNKHPGH